MTSSWDLDKVGRIFGSPPEEPGPAGRIGRYKLVREIAAGGAGIVYEAEDTGIGRVVALKLLKSATAGRESFRHRFRREAEAAAGIAHPHVVRVFDAGEEGDRLYLAMELVRGRPFSALLRERGLPLRKLLEILHKVSQGVAAAHAAGVVHRDLKPGNILMTEEGEPKVGDFGLAQFVDSESRVTQTGVAVGTPAYMAPEQVSGDRDRTGPPTDVYALGAILYELITGRVPHSGPDLYAKIARAEPARPSALNSRIDEKLEAMCLKALEKDPTARYPDARAFSEDLGRYLSGEAVSAARPGAVARSLKWIGRNRAVAILGLALAGLVAGVAAWRSAEASAVDREIRGLLARGESASRDHDGHLADLGRLLDRESDLAVALVPDRREQRRIVQGQIQESRRKASASAVDAVSSWRAVLLLRPGSPEARQAMENFAARQAEWDQRRRASRPRTEAGWWKLDDAAGEVAVDSSATGNHGRRANGCAVRTEGAPLRFANGGSLWFDGIDDFVDVPADPMALVSASFTMSFWARPTATRPTTPEASAGITGNRGQRYAIFPTWGNRYGPGDAAAGVSVGTNGVSVFEHAASFMPSRLVHDAEIRNWVHIAVVYRDNRPTLYVNGEKVKSALQSGYLIRPGASLGGIGTAEWREYGQYEGGLDDVRLYGRALEESEIAVLAEGWPAPDSR